MNYTIIILLKASHQWLSLSRKDRDLFVTEEIQVLLKRYSHTCKISLYDSDFTHASVSDFMIIETDSLEDYGYLMGYFRESKTFAAPYFEIQELVIGVPNNFRGSMDIATI